MKHKIEIIAFALAISLSALSAYAQETVPELSKSKMDLAKAEMLVPRPQLHPIKSLIPGDSTALDTLDTSDPAIKLVLYNDNTWKYIKDSELLTRTDWFANNWENDKVDPFKLEYDQLPERTTLWLVDETCQFCCPVQTKVYSKFGIRRRRRHQGCDLPLKIGDPVRAAFDGKVRMSMYTKGYGNLIVVRHTNGLETTYAHLSKRNVEVGDWVNAGDLIGDGGSTGRSTGPHLHFETRYQGYAFDPEWIIDFENGILRTGIFTLKKKQLSINSKYVPESEEEEEEILLAEAEDREAAAKKAAEEAAKKYHTIKSGDTLGALAIKYHTTVRQLCAWNGIKDTSILRLGQKLRVH